MDVEVYRKDRTHKRVTRKISLYLLIHHFSNWKHTPSILLLYYFHHYSELFIAIPHHNTTLVLPCFSFSHYPFRDPKWPLPPLSSPLTPCFQLNTTLSLHLQPFPNPSLASASPSIQGSPLPSPPSIAEDPNSLSGPLWVFLPHPVLPMLQSFLLFFLGLLGVAKLYRQDSSFDFCCWVYAQWCSSFIFFFLGLCLFVQWTCRLSLVWLGGFFKFGWCPLLMNEFNGYDFCFNWGFLFVQTFVAFYFLKVWYQSRNCW